MSAAETTVAEAQELAGPPVLVGRPGDAELTANLLQPVLEPTRKGWLLLLLALGGGVGFWLISLTATFAIGIGAWGNNIPVAWAFDIINFVWWIGIGHAGTLISAIGMARPSSARATPWDRSPTRSAASC